MSQSIPETQKAQVIEKTGGPVEFKDIPVQKPGPDEVLINIKYSGVCHTDLHAVNGDWPLPTKLPLVGGHEGEVRFQPLLRPGTDVWQVLVLLSRGATLSKTLRSATTLESSGSMALA